MPVPAPGEVLLKVSVAGICGSELSGYLGKNSLRRPPLVMGHEFTGVVVEGTGPLAAGTPVVVNPLLSCGDCDRCAADQPHLCRRRALVGAARAGGFAEYVAVPISTCLPIPAGLDPRLAALAEPLACAVRAVEQAGVRPGDDLLVYGAGTIGLLCLAVARRAGCNRVAVADTSPTRLTVAERWGADAVINPAAEDTAARVQALTKGRGVDTVIDAVGHGATRTGALRALRPGGLAIFVGLHEEESNIPVNWLVRQELRITGSFAYTPAHFRTAVDLLAAGFLEPLDRWAEVRPLAAGRESFERLLSPNQGAVKILLEP